VESIHALSDRLWKENSARHTPLLSFNGEDGFVEASLLRSASDLRDIHQLDEGALEIMDLLLALAPGCSGAMLFRAETLLLSQNFDDALECVDSLLRILSATDPPMVRFRAAHLKAIILNRLGRNLEANEFLEIAFEYHTGDMWAWTDAATIQLELKQLQKAASSIERAIELAESASHKINTDQIWFRKGLIMQKLKRHDDSIEAFQRAISLHDTASYRFHLGESYRKSSKNVEALEHFERAVQLQPDYLVAWNSAGLARSSQRDYTNALSCFEKALEISPSDCVVWANKGESLFMQGHYQLAVECFDKSLECAAGDPQSRLGFVWIRKGKALCLIGSYERAVECFDHALQDNQEDPVAWEWKGRSLFEQGKMQESLTCYDVALKLSPDDFFAWSGKGMALGASGFRYFFHIFCVC
jgi:tetratricopeptide (TPR) repeat protein